MFVTRPEPLLETKGWGDIEDLTEKKLQAYVFTKRIALEPLFSDFDRQNANKITIEQFKRGLASCGLVLNVKEVEALVRQYSVPIPEKSVCLVDWRKFCESINTVFAPKVTYKKPDMEACDSTSLVKTQRDLKIHGVRLQKFTDSKHNDNPVLVATVKQLHDDAQKRRLFAKAFFKEFDKLNRGVITHTQYQRCLSTLGWDLKEEQVKALLWKYSTENPDFIDYRSFLADIDPPQLFESAGGLSTDHKTAASEVKRSSCSSDVEQLLCKLQAEIYSRQLYLRDTFYDFDPLRSGVINADRFRSVLDVTARVSITDEELQLLVERFQSPKGSDCIDYMQFVTALEAIFTNPNVDRCPTDTTPNSHTIRTLLSQVEQRKPESEEEKHAIDGVMSRLRKMVQSHSIHHKPFFQSMDKTNSGFVSVTQFAAVLSTLKMSASAEEVNLLQRRYGKASDPSRVRYIAFCRDLDSN